MKRQERCVQHSSNCSENTFNSGFKIKKQKTLNSSILRAAFTSTLKFPLTHCPCGGELCKIKLSPKTGKPFYCCPSINEMHCGYFKWCDKLKRHEILVDRPLPYPISLCGAGICRLEIQREGPNSGRSYFCCTLKKGYGMCKFWQWTDDYYQPTSTTAFDNSIAIEINGIRRDFENGEIDLDFPSSPFDIRINAADESLPGDMTHPSPLPSPSSPLDAEALSSMESQDEGWWW